MPRLLVPLLLTLALPAQDKTEEEPPLSVVLLEKKPRELSEEQLEAAKTDKTKMLIFCSPSNPTGAVYTKDEVREIGQWLVDNDIWVMDVADPASAAPTR